MSKKNVTLKISADSKNAEKGIDSVAKKLNKFSAETTKKFSGIAKLSFSLNAVSTAVSVVSSAVGKAIGTMSDLADAYKAQVRAEAQLETAARNNPYLNYDSVRSLKAFASEMQGVGTVGDEVLMPLMAQLAAAGRTQSEIQDIIQASLDVSASGAMSLESAVKSLNKTYSGTAGGLSSISTAVKGLTAEELKAGKAVEVIKAQYAGMMKETTELTGGTEQLANAWGDFKEIVGHGFHLVLNPIAKKLAGIVSAINTALAGAEKLDALRASDDDKDRYFIRQAEKQYADREALIERYRAQALEREKDYARKEAEVMKRENASTFGELSKGNQMYLMQYRESWEEAVRKVNEELEKQDELRQSITDAQYRTGRREEEAVEEERAAAAQAEMNRRNADAAEIIGENTKALESQIRKINQKYALMEAEGKEIDDVARKTEILSAKESSYLDLISRDTSLVTENNAAAKKRLADILKDSEELSRLAASVPVELSFDDENMAREALKTDIEDAIGKIDIGIDPTAALESMSTLSMELDSVMREISERLSELLGGDLSEKEMEQVNYLTDLYADYAEKRKSLAESITEAETAAAEKQKEAMMSAVSNVQSLLGSFSSILSSMSSMWSQQVEAETSREMAELDKQYKEGAVSEEEYYKKKEKIEKEAAEKQYQMQMWAWGAQVAQAGAAQLASVIASKPAPPSFASGGIVQGSSYSGDKVQANVNSGEMILNARQQRALWDAANGGGGAAAPQLSVVINNNRSNDTSAEAGIDNGQLIVTINKIVNDSMAKGVYNDSLAAAQNSMDGSRYYS